MKYIFSTIILFSISLYCFSQSLGVDRINRIKNCTVKILIDSTTVSGTGFFITSSGQILTCWHVIDPAIIRDSLNKIIKLKKIFAVRNNGEKIEIGIATSMFNKGTIQNAVGYDFCLLGTVSRITTDFLKIGDFDSLKEGDEVYTCGFPIGISMPFVSRGFVSTKFIDTTNSITINGIIEKKPKSGALLDITLNAGNSGGAILKIGKNMYDDEVIGLADFVINPIGNKNEKDDIDILSKGIGRYNISGADLNTTFIYLIQILSSLSFGVSGCVSTNHFLNELSNIKN